MDGPESIFMIAQLLEEKENVKFVVREKGCRQMFLSASPFNCVLGVHGALVLDSAPKANQLLTMVVDHPDDWEVEQIVVC